MKIVLLTQGFLEYTSQLASSLVEHHEVIFLTFDGYQDLAAETGEQERIFQRLLDSRVQRVRVPATPKRHPASLRTVNRVVQAVQRLRPDILHVQEGLDYRIYWILRRLGMPYVLTVHEPRFHELLWEKRVLHDPARRLEHALVRAVRRRAARIVVHGERLKADLASSGIAPEKIRVILPGCYTYLSRWLEAPTPSDPHEILLFGRVAPYKGVQTLIDAEPLVSRHVPSLRITVAGRLAEPERYLQTITNPERFEFVTGFIGFDRAAQLYGHCGCVVLPYLAGTMSAVIGTAFAFGKPVVATRVGSFDEIVSSGVNGLLVEPGNPVQLADALVKLLLDAELAASLGKRAQEDARGRFSWSAAAGKHQGLYEECLSGNSGASRVA